MWNVLRSVAGVVLGAALALGLISAIDAINHRIYPPPESVVAASKAGDMTALAEAIAQWLPEAPVGALAMLPVAWIGGTFFGSSLAAWVAPRAHLLHALLAGLLPFLGTIAALWMIPHPAWLTLAGLLGVPLAAVAAGVIRQRFTQPSVQPYDMREKNMAC
jgi:hypothetical protein